MELSGLRIKITETFECPYCQTGDEFEFTGCAMVVNSGSFFCMTMMEDLIKTLPLVAGDTASAMEFVCCDGEREGCAGRMSYRIEKIPDENGDAGMVSDKDINVISKLLLNLPMFKSFDQNSMRGLLSHFKYKSLKDLKLKSCRNGEILLRKGQPGMHLFIIIAGKVEVLDEDENIIITLEKGDAFGEMSMISGKAVGSTVRSGALTTVLRFPGKEFNALLSKFPSLQSYFTRLLTLRLANSNAKRAYDLSSAIAGKLSEISPEELLQTLNFNRKTGVLDLQFANGSAEVYFQGGEVIHVSYNSLKPQPAFSEIIKNRSGKFQFNPGLPQGAAEMRPLGNFMGMLMDALKEMDEDEMEKNLSS